MSQLRQVLIVDGRAADGGRLRRQLANHGFESAVAHDAREASALLDDHPFEVVLLGWSSGDADAPDLCRAARERDDGDPVHVIAVIAAEHLAEVQAALDAGADDCVVAPVDEGALLARLRIAGRIRRLERRLRETTARLESVAHDDALTGALARDRLYERLESAARHATRYRRPLAVALCDLDGFRSVNRCHGREVGDAVLAEVARRLAGQIRDGSDWMARHGDDAFAVVLPEVDLVGGLAAAERLRHVVASSPIETPAGPVGVTASLGVVAVPPPPDVRSMPDVEAVLDLAERCLDEARVGDGDRAVGRELPPSGA